MSICIEICSFYRNHIAPQEIAGQKSTNNSCYFVKKTSPISRLEFFGGAFFSLLYLVQKVAQSIFFLVGSILTLGLHEGTRKYFLKNAREGLVYTGAVALGLSGILFPQTINQEILEIPSEGLIVQIPSKD